MSISSEVPGWIQGKRRGEMLVLVHQVYQQSKSRKRKLENPVFFIDDEQKVLNQILTTKIAFQRKRLFLTSKLFNSANVVRITLLKGYKN